MVIAASGGPLEFLKGECPGVEILNLPGYGITYPTDGSMATAMARQMPKLIGAARRERSWLDDLCRHRRIDFVISDNRFGFHQPDVPSVYITHQLIILPPGGQGWARSPLAFFHQRIISRFTECWVPDYAGEENLSGDLSHTSQRPSNVHFIGPLSRFHLTSDVSDDKPDIAPVDLLVILSGPEPQRSRFEEIILKQASGSDLRLLIIRGLPRNADPDSQFDGRVIRYPHLSTASIRRAANSAKAILARPGYSTLMDLPYLACPAILVPTPGQTEQEYLARRLADRGQVVVSAQDDFNLERCYRQIEAGSIAPLPLIEGESDSPLVRVRALLGDSFSS
ncbi:MAG: glycosyltransferase [Calditrichaeota bacterium]|nr:glycosyltransferase [Calditrichota bacterium]